MIHPVDRYGNFEPTQSTSRGSGEIRNMDQYSSDEEYQSRDGRGIRRRYNMRENPQKISRFQDEYRNVPLMKSERQRNGDNQRFHRNGFSDRSRGGGIPERCESYINR